MEMKYYSLKQILKKNAQYNIIIGERSNGKTYACLLHCLKEYICNGNQFAIVRRWKEDVRGKELALYSIVYAQIMKFQYSQMNNLIMYTIKMDVGI